MLIIPTLLATTLVYGDVQIEQVLPDNTIAVISIEDVSSFASDLQEMGLFSAFCEIGKVISASENITAETCPIKGAGFEKFSDAFGLDSEDFKIPATHAGAGLYPVVDDETSSVGVGVLFLMEIDSTLSEGLTESLQTCSTDCGIEVEQIDLVGRNVYRMSGFLPEEVAMQLQGYQLPKFDQLFLSVSDGYLVLCTEPDGMASVFTEIDGKTERDTLAEFDDYIELINRIGSDGDLHAAVLLTNLADTIMQMDTSNIAMMALPIIKSLFGDIDGIAEAVSLNPTTDVVINGKYAILMNDGRSGLMSLMSAKAARTAVPSFVGDDTIDYSQSHIDISKIVPLLKEVVMNNPLLAMQVGPAMEEIELGATAALAPLGSELHFVSSGSLPMTENSIGYLFAIECNDEEAFGTYLGETMPQMGADPTDFRGSQMFTIDFGGGMMMPMEISFSIAVGGGYAFLGTTHAVENALRSIANPKSAIGTHGLNAAVELLDNSNVSSWGFGNPALTFEIQQAMMEDMNQEMFADIAAFDPEMAEEMQAEIDKSIELQKAITNTIAVFLGPMAWNLHVVDTGFTAEFIMTKQSEEHIH